MVLNIKTNIKDHDYDRENSENLHVDEIILDPRLCLSIIVSAVPEAI